MTFLFISHHLQEIYEICERVAVMRDGRLVAEAAVGDLDQGKLVAAMVGESYASAQPTGRDDPAPSRAMTSASVGPDSRPIVLDVDSVSVAGSVEDVSIRIRAGERVGLAGLAGSGKSELAQAIVGQRAPTRRPDFGQRQAAQSRPRRPRPRDRGRLPAGGSPRQWLLQQPLGRGEHRAPGSPPPEPVAGLRLARPAPRTGRYR